MILRKPYAFLIKYFKVIHIIMFLIFVYLTFSLRKIYMFFSNYVKTENFVYTENMVTTYIKPLMFISVIIITIMAILIYLLMYKKKKPVFFYRVLIIYCVFLLVTLAFYVSFFASLDVKTYTSLNIVIYRDIMAFLYYINYFYVGFSFIRGFGFDIKKFSFEKDKKEIAQDEEDNAEVEVGLNLDKDTVISHFKKEKREFKYYIKENAYILMIMGIILILGLSIYLYSYFFVTNKVYKQTDVIDINNIEFRINNIYLTNVDKYNEVINRDNDFIIINLNILNKQFVSFDKEKFRINIDNEFSYPIYTLYDEFSDISGNYYDNSRISAGSNNYLLIFKVKKNINSKVYFEILESKRKEEFNYARMLINPEYTKKTINKININNYFQFNDQEIQIKNIGFTDKTSFNYEECIGQKCYNFTKTIKPDKNDKVMILKMDNINNIDIQYFEDYLGVIYDNNVLSSKVIRVLGKNDNTIYLNVPSIVERSDNIIITFINRETENNILVKGAF